MRNSCSSASDYALSLTDVNPVWFQLPLAPLVAARSEKRTVDDPSSATKSARFAISIAWSSSKGQAGGSFRSPKIIWLRDLAADIGLPIIVVAPNKLGVINHTLLTLEAIAAREQRCAGVILNESVAPAEIPDLATTTNRAVLESLMKVPLLCAISYRQSTLPSLRELGAGKCHDFASVC